MQDKEFSSEGKLIGKYILEKVLGEGQFGKVFRARHKDNGELFAIKKMPMNRIDSNSTLKRLMMTEVSIMRDITHPNILHLFEFLRSKDNYYLVLQYCNQGDMEHYIKQKGIRYFEEKEAVMMLKQIMNGFAELRKRKILHRDFKLANIFMSNDQLIIGDFGFAKAGVEITNTKLGSPLTMAPELLFNNDDDVSYNSKADIWSIGVVFYQMLFGDPPFFGLSVPELIKNIKKCCQQGIRFPRPISDESKDLLQRMLVIDPKTRIEWSECFDHPVFAKFTAKPVDPNKDFELVFGAIKQTADVVMHHTEIEFNRNKKDRETLDKVQFLKQNEIEQLNKKVPEQNIEEKPLDEKTRKTLFDEMVAKEIYFRYCHEINKISFLAYTASFIQISLSCGRFASQAQTLFNISLLNIKKATVLAQANLAHLSAKSNIYGISPIYFAIFCTSKSFDESQQLFNQENGRLISYYMTIQNRAVENSIQNIYSNLLNQANPNLLEMDSSLKAERDVLIRAESALSDQSERYQLKLLIQCIGFCIASESSFPYLDKNAGNAKFNWELFYKFVKGEEG